MDRHRQFGMDSLRNCCASQEVLDTVHNAAAWFDGSKRGFDRRGEDLPLGSRLIAIVDAFDSMTTDRVYRPAMSRERAMAELFACAGTQFDPQLVRTFCTLAADNALAGLTPIDPGRFSRAPADATVTRGCLQHRR